MELNKKEEVAIRVYNGKGVENQHPSGMC